MEKVLKCYSFSTDRSPLLQFYPVKFNFRDPEKPLWTSLAIVYRTMGWNNALLIARKETGTNAFRLNYQWKWRLLSVSEFPASRRTVACRVERGGTVRDAVNWVRGDTKIKQKRNTNGSGGGGEHRESSSCFGGKCPWNHIKFAEWVVWESLTYKVYNLVMGLRGGGELARCFNKPSEPWLS